MTPSAYKALRKSIGTQQAVADLLEVHRVTIAKRESGDLEIHAEAAWAMEKLATSNMACRAAARRRSRPKT